MNSAIDLSFVAKYQYPTRVKKHFEQILSHIDPSRVESVILTGSTSRGELSYQITEEGLSLYSDYEFMVIARTSVDPEDEIRLTRCFKDLEGNLSNNPLFHIDFSYINMERLKNLPFHLKHYETKKNGVAIYGRNLIHLIPSVNLGSLDFKDLHKILIWRLWALLLYLPRHMVGGRDMTDSQVKSYQYVLCRNMLDILTWILPLKGVLLPSFRQRADYLNAKLASLRDDILVNEEFAEFIKECMVGKFEIQFCGNVTGLYTKVISYFLKAREYLFNSKGFRSTIITDQTHISQKLWSSFFHDSSYRTKGREIKFILKNFSHVETMRVIPWIVRGKFSLMLEFLYMMHLAFVYHLKDSVEAFDCLNNCRIILRKLNIRKTSSHDYDGFSPSWLLLRRLFADFMMDYFYALRAKRHYIYSVIG